MLPCVVLTTCSTAGSVTAIRTYVCVFIIRDRGRERAIYYVALWVVFNHELVPCDEMWFKEKYQRIFSTSSEHPPNQTGKLVCEITTVLH